MFPWQIRIIHLRIGLKPGFNACKRHVLSGQEGTVLPSKGRAEGRVPPQCELPSARNILVLEQGEGQASKGSLFNSANAMVIFAGAITQMLFAVRNAFPKQVLLTIYPFGCLEMKQFLLRPPRRVFLCRGLGLRFGSRSKGRTKILLWAGEVGFCHGGGRAEHACSGGHRSIPGFRSALCPGQEGREVRL